MNTMYRKYAPSRRTLMIFTCFSVFLTGALNFPALWTSPPSLPVWRLVFDDEFNGNTLNTNLWNIENAAPRGYQNCCLDYGLQSYTPAALSFNSGTLQITTSQQQGGGYAYTSGAITTENKFSFLYGRVDIRAKLPKTQGLWPAFWLLPNGSRGIAPYEVDMMELLGNDPHTIYMTNHWGLHQAQGLYVDGDFSQQYHVFSLVWSQQSLAWYIDGVERFQTSLGVSNLSMYLIINSAIGGRWSGVPNVSTVLPQYMNIDYVRIYQPLLGYMTPIPGVYIPRAAKV